MHLLACTPQAPPCTCVPLRLPYMWAVFGKADGLVSSSDAAAAGPHVAWCGGTPCALLMLGDQQLAHCLLSLGRPARSLNTGIYDSQACLCLYPCPTLPIYGTYRRWSSVCPHMCDRMHVMGDRTVQITVCDLRLGLAVGQCMAA